MFLSRLKRCWRGDVALVVVLSTLLAIAGNVMAGDTAVPVKQQQADQILQELREIRQLPEKIEQEGIAKPPARSATPKMVTISRRNDRPALGTDNAPLTVVEYTD